MSVKSVFCLFVICVICSCDNPRPDNVVDADTIKNTSEVDSSVYISTRNAANEIQLPFLMAVDSIEQMYMVNLDAKSSYELLPGEFEFESYKRVQCFGRSTAGKTPLLWFLLTSEGEFEEWPDNQSIVVVMYDCNSRPYDVYNTSSTGVGYSYSYVRADSIYSVMVDEMENINITTAEIAVSEKGFLAGNSETKTFNPDEKGYRDSRNFMNHYITLHSPEVQKPISQ